MQQRDRIAIQQNMRGTFVVNGESSDIFYAPYKTLLEVLREDLDLTGTKHGCELGECGACAVLVDGAPPLSCLVLAVESEGRAMRPCIRCRLRSLIWASRNAATAPPAFC